MLACFLFIFLRYLIPRHLHPKKKPCTHYKSLLFSPLVTNPCLLNPCQCGALCLSVLVSFCILSSLSFHMHFTVLNCQDLLLRDIVFYLALTHKINLENNHLYLFLIFSVGPKCVSSSCSISVFSDLFYPSHYLALLFFPFLSLLGLTD